MRRGCRLEGEVQVEQPAPLSLDLDKTDETLEQAADGTVSVSVTGGTPPYTYEWTHGPTTAQLSGLTPGTYTVRVRDAGDCLAESSVEIGAGPPDCSNFSVLLNGSDLRCHGDRSGALSADPQGGEAPYTYLWSTGAQTAGIDQLEAGTYSLQLSDARGCSLTENYELQQPDPLELDLVKTDETIENYQDGTISAQPTGGTEPYTYSWSDGSQDAQRSGLAPGTYHLTLTDANDCSISATVTLEEGAVDCSGFAVSLDRRGPGLFRRQGWPTEARAHRRGSPLHLCLVDGLDGGPAGSIAGRYL